MNPAESSSRSSHDRVSPAAMEQRTLELIAELKKSEAELRTIVDMIPQLIAVLAPDGQALYVNQASLEYTGLSAHEATGHGFRRRVFHPDDVERLKGERADALARGEPFENEQRARRHDGQYRWLLIRYRALRDEQGRVMRWYCTGTDIDDRKRAEERIRNENLALREEIDRSSMFEEIVGSSPLLRRVLTLVERVADTDSTVLITGETGSGKELIARGIHKKSHRAARAFIRVNCAAIPSSLVASELWNSSAMKKAHSPARSSDVWGDSNPPTAARFCSTKVDE